MASHFRDRIWSTDPREQTRHRFFDDLNIHARDKIVHLFKSVEPFLDLVDCYKAKGKPGRPSLSGGLLSGAFEFPLICIAPPTPRRRQTGSPYFEFPEVIPLNDILGCWAKEHRLSLPGHVKSRWVMRELVSSVIDWAHSRNRYRGTCRFHNNSFYSVEVLGPDHPARCQPSGLDWVVDGQHASGWPADTLGAGGRNVGYRRNIRVAEGWNPTRETEEHFRTRVERYIEHTLKACRAVGLSQRAMDARQPFLKADFEWLIRHRVGHESLSKIARSVPLPPAGPGPLGQHVVRDRISRLAKWLILPASPQRRSNN